MKRTILALVVMACTGLSLYACTGDDSAFGGGDASATNDDGSSGNDGSFSDAEADDSGPLNPTSLQIQAVRNAAAADSGAADDAGLAVNLPIDGALVTYVRPVVGDDPAGFFLQSQQTGPAIFVAIDPTTLSPVPAPGDQVSMTVTAVANVDSLREIIALTSWNRASQGNAIAPLLRHVSTSTDLVSKLDNYESEYIELDGFVASKFGSSGTGSVSAEITSAAVSSPTTNLELRIPATVQSALDPELTCKFSLTGVMWRFGNDAQPSAWANADLSMTCAAPQVVNAVGTDLNTVSVAFDRDIALSSVLGDGTQFTITDGADGGVGLSVSAAVLSDARTVTLTTSTQTADQNLLLTVANSVDDVLSVGIDAAHDTANFVGFVQPAVVRFSELNPNISGSHDLVELQVLADGNLVGFTIQENLAHSPAVLATLPFLSVVAGDLVVVHLNADLADGGAGAVIDEVTTKTDCPSDAGCYDTAWDVKDTLKGKTGLAFAGRAVVVKDPKGEIQDGISWWTSSGGVTAGFVDETNALIDAGMWVGCGGTYCTDSDAAAAISIDAKGCSTTVGGKSVQRISDIGTNTHSTADWTLDASTFGLPNTP